MLINLKLMHERNKITNEELEIILKELKDSPKYVQEVLDK